MPAILLLVGLVVMFLVISLLNNYNTQDKNPELEELDISDHSVSSCQTCGHTGTCQHKIF